MEQQEPERANYIRELPWVIDGIEEYEEIAVTALTKCGLIAPATFDTLVSNPQPKERVSNETGQALGRLCDLEAMSPDLWSDFMRKSWVQDGLTRDEAEIVQNLYAMIFESVEHEESHRIWTEMINMPFLETVDSFDVSTLVALAQINNGFGFGEGFVETMSHPKISDGISDEEAKVVALSYTTYHYRPESTLRLLTDADVYSEERTIVLPLSGEVSLAIFRFRDQQSPSLDYLERSAYAIEKFMGEPFPTAFIALMFDDALPPGYGGAHFGTHIGLLPQFEDEWQSYLLGAIAHETAHYYWGSGRAWIAEGGASLLGAFMEKGWDTTAVEIKTCESAATIAELEALNPKFEDPGFGCNYFLGRSIFLDLYRTLGDETFRRGFRGLYLKSQREDHTDNCEGTDLAICHVAAAFKTDASAGAAEQVDEVVRRWYGPLP